MIRSGYVIGYFCVYVFFFFFGSFRFVNIVLRLQFKETERPTTWEKEYTYGVRKITTTVERKREHQKENSKWMTGGGAVTASSGSNNHTVGNVEIGKITLHFFFFFFDVVVIIVSRNTNVGCYFCCRLALLKKNLYRLSRRRRLLFFLILQQRRCDDIVIIHVCRSLKTDKIINLWERNERLAARWCISLSACVRVRIISIFSYTVGLNVKRNIQKWLKSTVLGKWVGRKEGTSHTKPSITHRHTHARARTHVRNNTHILALTNSAPGVT